MRGKLAVIEHARRQGEERRIPGPASIDLMVPDTIAARRSMMISLPSCAISLTGSIEVAAFAEATAALIVFCTFFWPAVISMATDCCCCSALAPALAVLWWCRCAAPALSLIHI